MVPPVVVIGDKVNWSISKIALRDISWLCSLVWGALTEATLWPNQETVSIAGWLQSFRFVRKVPDPVTVPPFPARAEVVRLEK